MEIWKIYSIEVNKEKELAYILLKKWKNIWYKNLLTPFCTSPWIWNKKNLEEKIKVIKEYNKENLKEISTDFKSIWINYLDKIQSFL